jgi:uncharacterized protein (TIGR00297 family)
MEIKFLIGFAGSLVVAGIAFQKRSLSVSGGLAAIVLGTLMYALGDVKWYGLLLAFFISSSVLSHCKKEEKREVEQLFAKTGTRDWLQVAANGGIGLVAVLGAFWSGAEEVWYAFYIGTIAAVTSDTWATEIGVLAKGKPRHIFTWREVESGTSGGVSMLGLGASLAGGLFIGGMAYLFTGLLGTKASLVYWLLGGIGGMAGSLVDSAIGAIWQQMYQCRICGKETERKEHCRQQTQVVKGYAWCTNDVVNMVAALVGGVVACLVWWGL